MSSAVLIRATARASWTDAEVRAYADRMTAVLRDAAHLSDETVRESRRLLRAVQRESVERIAFAMAKADAGGSTFDLARIGSTIQEVEELIMQMRDRITDRVAASIDESAVLGRRLVEEPLSIAVGTDVLPAHGLSRSTVGVAARFSADLITQTSTAAIRRISAELQFGVVGVKTPFEVMQAIGRNLDSPSVFRSIAARAEAITRTEMGRMFSLAGQARLDEAKLLIPELKKQWRWSGRGRINHAAIHWQIRDVEEPYDVPGTSRSAPAQLMYPRDPAGSAEQTINCSCESLPYISGLSRGLPAAA